MEWKINSSCELPSENLNCFSCHNADDKSSHSEWFQLLQEDYKQEQAEQPAGEFERGAGFYVACMIKCWGEAAGFHFLSLIINTWSEGVTSYKDSTSILQGLVSSSLCDMETGPGAMMIFFHSRYIMHVLACSWKQKTRSTTRWPIGCPCSTLRRRPCWRLWATPPPSLFQR